MRLKDGHVSGEEKLECSEDMGTVCDCDCLDSIMQVGWSSGSAGQPARSVARLRLSKRSSGWASCPLD